MLVYPRFVHRRHELLFTWINLLATTKFYLLITPFLLPRNGTSLTSLTGYMTIMWKLLWRRHITDNRLYRGWTLGHYRECSLRFWECILPRMERLLMCSENVKIVLFIAPPCWLASRKVRSSLENGSVGGPRPSLALPPDSAAVLQAILYIPPVIYMVPVEACLARWDLADPHEAEPVICDNTLSSSRRFCQQHKGISTTTTDSVVVIAFSVISILLGIMYSADNQVYSQ